jgi:N-acetylmuramoyl-L-alanine amidase
MKIKWIFLSQGGLKMKKKLFFSLVFAPAVLLIFAFSNCFADSLYVCVDPGHGGSDDGTYGRVYGTKEKFANLKVGLALKDSITNDFEYWAVPIMTRETDVYLETPERANIAMYGGPDSVPVDQFLVIHHNAVDTTPPNPPRPDSSKNYTVTFYCDDYWVYPGDTIQRDVSADLAERVNAKVKELLQQAVPSIPWGNHDAEIKCWTVLERTSMISAYCEISFMTNYKIDSLYKYDATNYSRKEANGVYKGWHQYIDDDPIIVVRNHFWGGYVLVDNINHESPFHGCWRPLEWHTIQAFDQYGYDPWEEPHSYVYCRWGDGGAQQHSIYVGYTNDIYTAYYSWSDYFVNVDDPNGGETYGIGQTMRIY